MRLINVDTSEETSDTDPKRPITQVKIVNLSALPFWMLAAYLLYHLLDTITLTLLLFGVAFFLAALLDRPISWLDKHGLSRGKSVAVIALLFLTLIGAGIAVAVPPLIEQATEFSQNAPKTIATAQRRLESYTSRYPVVQEQLDAANLPQKATEYGQKFLPQVGRYSLNFLGGILSALIVFLITLYTVAEPRPLVRGALSLFPRKHRQTALRVLAGVTTSLQAWVRATALMMVIVGVVSGLGLWAIGVKSPLLFGIIAGIGEAIPTIGPIISAIPPFLVTLADDPAKAMWVLVLFLVIQQVENNLLVPRIMATTLNLHSVSVMFFVIVMGSLVGLLGILLAPPLCAVLKVIYQEVYLKPKRAKEKAEENTGANTEVVPSASV